MPATSQAQRAAANMALEGKGPMAGKMPKVSLEHFAHTKGKLPEHAKKAFDLSQLTPNDIAYLEGFCKTCSELNQDPEALLGGTPKEPEAQPAPDPNANMKKKLLQNSDDIANAIFQVVSKLRE